MSHRVEKVQKSARLTNTLFQSFLRDFKLA